MIRFGNHLKMHLPRSERERARQFYAQVLECRPIASTPYPDLDLFEFSDGTVAGLFFRDDVDLLSEADHGKATWLEIKTDEPEKLQEKLVEFGVERIDFPDPSRFYFRAPGGQVYRVAPLDGGL